MNLAVFFTRGVSLELWIETGLFEREKLIYEQHLKCGHFDKIFWLTYGSKDERIAKELHDQGILDEGIHVLAMPHIFESGLGKLIYSFFLSLIQLKSFRKTDILKTNQMDGSWSAVFAKWIYKKPLVVRTGYTASIFKKKQLTPVLKITFYEMMEAFAYRFCNLALVASRQDQEYVCVKYHLEEDRIHILNNYIETTLFRPTDMEKWQDRVLFVGRLSNQKNLFNLIDACKKAGVGLDIVGEGELRKKLEAKAKKLKADVRFLGRYSNTKLPEIICQYPIFVLPSFYEGNPKTLLEAMSCGTAVIGADVEGVKEIITHGENGLLCGTDSNSITKAINTLMRNENMRDRIGKNARSLIIEKNSVDRIAVKEFNLYKKLISSNI